MEGFAYPLTLSFKVIALAPQISVADASGRELLYVHQKLFKLKEDIRVYSDRTKRDERYRIAADRVLDFRARYAFTDPSGREVGAVQRHGARSILRARYDILDPTGRTEAVIEEENPWVKAADAVVGEIPLVNLFTGYFLHPRYAVKEVERGEPVLEIRKQRSFFESRFVLERRQGLAAPPAGDAEVRAVLAVLVMALLERERG